VVTTPPAPVTTTPVPLTTTPAPVVTTPPAASPDPTAVPAPVPTTSVLSDATTYVVQAGDTLWRIAVRMYGGGTDATAGYRWTEIAQANSVNGTLIVPGQTLTIPRP
jgi:nucleoid-associated protein YgaU